MPLPQIRSFAFTCADAERLAAFYVRLGFRRGDSLTLAGPYADLVGLPGSQLKVVRLHVGAETLELMEVLSLGPGLRPGRPVPAGAKSNDRSFQHLCLVTADLDAAAAPVLQELAAGRLRPISSAPQTLPLDNPSAAGIRAFKFHDPEGHALELLQFPPEKGEARWHTCAAAGPLLGIDHSAIGVADSERSGRFYAELLGLRRAGDGLNQGLEQDHLDGLVGTRVRITSHRCPMGPGVECLEYQAPPGGRDRPADTTAADHLHGQICLAVANLEAIANRVGQPPLALEPQAAAQLGFRRALPLHDPDGHALQVVEA